MMLTYPMLPQPICFRENKIQVLIVENAAELRRIIAMLRDQIDGADGEFVLSKAYQPVAMGKEAVLVTDVTLLDFGSKKLQTKLRQEACAAGAAYEKEFHALAEQINILAGKIGMAMDMDVSFSPVETWEELIGLMGFYVDSQSLSFPEQVLEYMKLYRSFFKKNLFIFYGLKAMLSAEELALFYRSVQYEKLNVLLIEDVQKKPLKECEETRIIDEDLCII